MEGKLLVLCDETPTINEWGQRIDKEGNVLKEKNGKFINTKEEVVEVDIHKRVINVMDLFKNMITPSIDTDIIYVDWNTIIPEDLDFLSRVAKNAIREGQIDSQILLDSMKYENQNLMSKAHLETLKQAKQTKNSPSLDYKFKSMDNFIKLFTDMLEKNEITAILPTFSNEKEEMKATRNRIFQAWRYQYKFEKESKGSKNLIKILPEKTYSKYEEVYKEAQKQKLESMKEDEENEYFEI